MSESTVQNPLPVYEFSGTARSGKGSIVADLEQRHDGIATEETGADYRAVTKTLLDEGVIDPDMSTKDIKQAVNRLDIGQMSDIVVARPQIVAVDGLGSLYTAGVSGIVSSVSPIPSVRNAVKAGFVRRVERVADDDSVDALLVDGRNLAQVVSAIPRTRLVMRTFVSCYNVEAALREIARNGQTGDSAAFTEAYRNIKKRNYDDAARAIDPVVPDSDAIDYWYDDEAFTATVQELADLYYGGDYTTAVIHSFGEGRKYTDVIRRSVGGIAVRTGRQVHFDTTPFRNYQGKPVKRMLDAADRMFVEASETYLAISANHPTYS